MLHYHTICILVWLYSRSWSQHKVYYIDIIYDGTGQLNHTCWPMRRAATILHILRNKTELKDPEIKHVLMEQTLLGILNHYINLSFQKTPASNSQFE